MTDSDSNERNIMTVKKKEWTSKKKHLNLLKNKKN